MEGRASTLIVAALLLAAGCGAVASQSVTTLFRPSRPRTSWEKTLSERTSIPFRDSVLTAADPIPTLQMRRVPPRHPERFERNHVFDKLIAPRREKATHLSASDDVQLAVSLQWLDDEFGLPPEVEFHRGLLCSPYGIDPNEVSLHGWYHGIELPTRALVYLDGDQVVDAMVYLVSVSEVAGSARPVVDVEIARQATEERFRTLERETAKSASKRLWPAKQCTLEFGRPSLPPDNSPDDLLIPLWSCDPQGAIHVDAYDGAAFRPREIVD